MYRWFISWRYLTTRLTNLIGIGGIAVGVGALIMILSIMTGFLEESKKVLRGDLADLVVQPLDPGRLAPAEPHALLDRLRNDPRVASATPRLNWFALVAVPGRSGSRTVSVYSNPNDQSLSGVQVIGVDVVFDDQLALWFAAGWARLLGFPWIPPQIEGEYETTQLQDELRRFPLSVWGRRVANPLFPFAPPPGLRPVGRPRATIIVGEQLAAQFGLEPGSPLQLSTFTRDPRTGDFYQSNREFVVGGTFRSGANAIDLGRVYVERAELWDFLGRGATYTEVLVSLTDYDRHGGALRTELAAELQERRLIAPTGPDPTARGQVKTWEDQRSAMLSAIENERVLMGIMLSLVMVVAGFTVFAILTLMVGEKRRDIGILASIGATRSGVLSTFLTVGLWNAVVGTTLGTIAGVLLARYINEIEIWLSNTFGVVIFNRDVYYFDEIPAVIEPRSVVTIVALALVSTLVAAAIPAWRAARLDPVAALRYE